MAKSDKIGPDELTDDEGVAIPEPSEPAAPPEPDANDALRSINPQGPKNNPTVPGPRADDKEELETPTHDHHTP